MSNILGAAEGQVWPGMLAAGRRFAVIGALAAVASLGRASPAEALAPPQAYCMPELARLSAEWNDTGFGIPQKPSQMIVYGRIGLTSSSRRSLIEEPDPAGSAGTATWRQLGSWPHWWASG